MGTKLDLRGQPGNADDWVTLEEGRQTAIRVAALNYVECSALTSEGLNRVIEEAISCYDSPTCRLWPEVDIPPEHMEEDLGFMVNDATFADVEFVYKGNVAQADGGFGMRRVWYAHRIVLSCGIAGEMFDKIFDKRKRTDSTVATKDSSPPDPSSLSVHLLQEVAS